MNSIIYLVDYEADDEDDLCLDQFYMNTERHMAVQKSLDRSHTKRALGASDFNFITKVAFTSVRGWKMLYPVL